MDPAPFHLEAFAITPEVFNASYPHRSHLPLNLTRVHPPFFLSRCIMAAAHPDDTSGTEPTPGMNTSHQPGSTHTPQSTAPHNLHTQSTQPFLPGNGPLHLAPSLTHQPELLLLHRMFDMMFAAGHTHPGASHGCRPYTRPHHVCGQCLSPLSPISQQRRRPGTGYHAPNASTQIAPICTRSSWSTWPIPLGSHSALSATHH